MDNVKIGKLIAQNRKEKNMTQKELGDKLNVSDKTISKWECGAGFPDVASVNDLASSLGISVSELLSGDIRTNLSDNGNMKKTKFYVCPICGNTITSTNPLSVDCCGRKLLALNAGDMKTQQDFQIELETIEDETYIRIQHPMKKEHYISFISYVTSEKLQMVKLYPEQDAEVRMKMQGHGFLYIYCTNHGLFKKIF